MRVIAGAAKGHNLQTIEGLATRPTTDRIKETLFNIIAFDLPEASFLDLFSGSGAIGIEALSRGAAEAVFVENAAECQKVIQANLVHTKLQERARLLQTDVLSALDRLAAEGKKFDIIFMDPPYQSGLEEPVLAALSRMPYVTDETLIVIEATLDRDFSFAEEYGFSIKKEKCYKTNKHVFLAKEEKK